MRSEESYTRDAYEAPAGQQRTRPSLQGWVIGVLKAFIVVVLALGLISQCWLLPTLSGDVAQREPGYAYLRMPYLITALLIIACFEAGLLALWRLLSMVGQGSVFSDRSFLWVDAIIWVAMASAVLTFGLLIHAAFIADVGPLPLLLALLVAVVIEVAFILLVVVMRGLLVTATKQHVELEAVI
ncbi:MAG: DUF2975 domain-containing protein [Bifidobacterium psychraerophilum]|uniref:DUF2975 domain-containing protein n=1 Tax=Bifidobacterium psychraerophilum TaxID=218140 RepID=UPI0039ED7CBC